MFIAQSPLTMLALPTCWQRTFSRLTPSQPTHQYFWDTPWGALNVLISSFTLATSSSPGQFGPPIALLCMVSPWQVLHTLSCLGLPLLMLLQWPLQPLLCLYSEHLAAGLIHQGNLSLHHTSPPGGCVGSGEGGVGAEGGDRLSSLCLMFRRAGSHQTYYTI